MKIILHLRRSKFKFSQAHFVSRLQIQQLLPLGLEQGLERGDKGKVRGWRDVIEPFLVSLKLCGQFCDTLVEMYAHLDATLTHIVVEVEVLEEL